MSRPSSRLPKNPSWEFLRKEAKNRLSKLNESGADLRLAKVQWEMAREYGFPSWSELKKHVLSSQQGCLNNAINALKAGKIVILFDDLGRENEADFVAAAEKVDADSINFMTKHGRGALCLSLSSQRADSLELKPLRDKASSDPLQACFTESIDARVGVTTGVSTADRARTIHAAVSPQARPRDLRRPGHVFTLRCEEGGWSTRKGHTEGSIELMHRAGLTDAAVVCEILNEDGSMARLDDMPRLVAEHQTPLVLMSQL